LSFSATDATLYLSSLGAFATVWAAGIGLRDLLWRGAVAERRLSALRGTTFRQDRLRLLLRPPQSTGAWCAAACVAGFILMYLATGDPVLGSVAAAGVFWMPSAYRRWLRGRSLVAMEEELCMGVQGIIGRLQAGQSLLQALESLRGEAGEPLRGVVSEALNRYRAGIPLAEAFKAVAERHRCGDLLHLSRALSVCYACGGSVTETLAHLSESLRARSAFRSEVRARTSEGRLTAWFLMLLPAGLVALFAVVDPGLIQPLRAHPLGRLGAAYALASWFAGAYLTGRVLDLPDAR